MRENIKRLIAVAIAVVLVASACPQVAFAALTAPKDFKNEIDDGNGNVDENSKLKKKIVVSNQKELEEALKTPGEKTIVFDSEEEMKLKIKEKYKGCEDLVINAPQAAVAISASVDKLTINDASKVVVKQAVSTLKINASDLSLKVAASGSVEAIKVLADEAKIQLANQGSVQKISANGTGCDISVQQKGTLEKITMKNPSKVSVGGSSDQKTEIVVKEGAKGSEISSSVPLALTSKAEVSLELKEGAEKSSVTLKGENAGISLNNQTSEKITITDSNGEKVDVKSKETAGAGVLPSPEEDKKEEKKQQEAAQAGGYSYSDPTPTPTRTTEESVTGYQGEFQGTSIAANFPTANFIVKRTFDSQNRQTRACWYISLEEMVSISGQTRNSVISAYGNQGPYLMFDQEYTYSSNQYTVVEEFFQSNFVPQKIKRTYTGTNLSDNSKVMIFEEITKYSSTSASDPSLAGISRVSTWEKTDGGHRETVERTKDSNNANHKTVTIIEYSDGRDNPDKVIRLEYTTDAADLYNKNEKSFDYGETITKAIEKKWDPDGVLYGENTYLFVPDQFELHGINASLSGEITFGNNWYERTMDSLTRSENKRQITVNKYLPNGSDRFISTPSAITYTYDDEGRTTKIEDTERVYVTSPDVSGYVCTKTVTVKDYVYSNGNTSVTETVDVYAQGSEDNVVSKTVTVNEYDESNNLKKKTVKEMIWNVSEFTTATESAFNYSDSSTETLASDSIISYNSAGMKDMKADHSYVNGRLNTLTEYVYKEIYYVSGFGVRTEVCPGGWYILHKYEYGSNELISQQTDYNWINGTVTIGNDSQDNPIWADAGRASAVLYLTNDGSDTTVYTWEDFFSDVC